MLEAKHLLLIGRTGEYHNNELTFFVRILNVKGGYNNVFVLIQPLAGKGTKWTKLEKVSIEKELQKSY